MRHVWRAVPALLAVCGILIGLRADRAQARDDRRAVLVFYRSDRERDLLLEARLRLDIHPHKQRFAFWVADTSTPEGKKTLDFYHRRADDVPFALLLDGATKDAKIVSEFDLREGSVPDAVRRVLRDVTGVVVEVEPAPRREAKAPAGRKTVAVLPFENLTGDAALDWIGAACAETLVSKLSLLDEVDMLDTGALLSAARERPHPGPLPGGEGGRRVVEQSAADAGATHVITGSYQRAGDSYLLVARLKEPEGEFVGVATNAKGADLFALQLKLAAALARSLGGKLPPEAEQAPTVSEDAYAHFGRGVWHAMQGDVERAREELRKAVELDPRFADAYGSLNWLQASGRGDAARQELAEADRLLRRGQWGHLQQFVEAYGKYRTLCDRWPDMVSARYGLGLSLVGLRRYADAWAAFREVHRRDPYYAYVTPMLFFDDFGRGDLDGWSVRDGSWRVVDGALCSQDPTHSRLMLIVPGSEDWRNYRLSCEFQIVRAGPNCRFSTSVYVDPESLTDYTCDDAAGKSRAIARHAWQTDMWHVLTTPRPALIDAAPHERVVDVTTHTGHVRIRWEDSGRAALEATDDLSEPSPVRRGRLCGTISFDVHDGLVAIKNVAVLKLSSSGASRLASASVAP